MTYKYNTFSELPNKDKRFIAMQWRFYLLCFSKPQVTTHMEYGLPPEAIRQFQEICRRKGLNLSQVEATKEAYNLINLMRVVNGQRAVITLTTEVK